jgi:hypothetical protein
LASAGVGMPKRWSITARCSRRVSRRWSSRCAP